MTDLELKDLVSFDDLVTPRIMPVVFWTTQAFNASFWIRRLGATATTTTEAGSDPVTGAPIAAATQIHWGNIVFCMLALAATIIVIRLLADLFLCIFRWQASTRGILMAMTGAPAQMAAGQAEPVVAAPAAAATRPAVVSPSPPWEVGTPQTREPAPQTPLQSPPPQSPAP